MPHILLTSTVAIVLITGLCTILWRRYRIGMQIVFAKEYLGNVVEWVNSSCRNMELYDWLIKNSTRMQNEMGDLGIAHTFQPPYRQVVYHSWPIVLNAIPEMNQMNIQGIPSVLTNYAHLVRDTLLRYIGKSEDQVTSVTKEIVNPIIWFREGVRFLLSLPIYTLSFLGVFSSKSARHLAASRTLSIISAFVSVVAFISSVMGIILGWQPLIELAKKWLDY